MKAGGRWNSMGVPMVYTSTSLALAILEVLVHLDQPQEPPDMMSLMLEMPWKHADFEVEKSKVLQQLPEAWMGYESKEARLFGDEWIASKRSLALPVPSIVVRGEWNVLINPLHPDAKGLVKVKLEPFEFDRRILKPRQ